MKFFVLALLAGVVGSVSVAGEPILIIGDSHVYGAFGESLYQTLEKQSGDQVHLYGAVGATALTYTALDDEKRTVKLGYRERSVSKSKEVQAKSLALVPQIEKLIDEIKPKVIIIELGDNFADYRNQKNDGIKKNIDEMVSAIRASKRPIKCFWVSPLWTSQDAINPYGKTNFRLKEVIHQIKQQAEPVCELVDSTKDLGLDPNSVKTGKDGLHFTNESGRKWGTAAGDFIITRIVKVPSSVKVNSSKGSH